MRLIRALLVSVVTAASAMGQDTPRASIVKIVVTQEEAEPRVAAGFVTDGGFVITTMGCIQKARSVQVTAGGGEAHAASGVAAYQNDANVALIAVDWGGAAPAALKVAEE